MRRVLAITCLSILAAAALAMGPAAQAVACSCMSLTEAEALAGADAVFEGVVIGPAGADDAGREQIQYEFSVEAMVKGNLPGDRVRVSTSSRGGSCGAGYALGQKWRVYATGFGHQLSSNLCAGNRLLQEDAASVRAVDMSGDTGPRHGLLLAAGLAILILAASVLAFRSGSARG